MLPSVLTMKSWVMSYFLMGHSAWYSMPSSDLISVSIGISGVATMLSEMIVFRV